MPQRSAILPDYTTPAELAAHLGVSERAMADKVRALGAYCKIGARVILLPDHVAIIMEDARCPSRSTGAARSGTTAAPSRDKDYEAVRALLIESSRSGSRPKPKQPPGEVISMDRGRN